MLPIAEDISIRMEVLNAQDSPISCMEATLRHLDGERAAILLPVAASLSCVHWGSRVRFFIEQQTFVYEIVGSVIAPLYNRADESTTRVESTAATATARSAANKGSRRTWRRR